MSNHRRPVVHDSEDTRDMAEITKKRMMEKMQSPLYVENKVRIAPPDYSKENLLATFAPQRNLTPEQIFWSIDNNNRKKAETLAPKPISALTVYPPNTPVKLVPRILPTKSQVKINLYVLTQLFTEFDKTCKTRITPSGLTEGERGFEQTKRCYLTEVIPFFKTLKEHFVGVQTALVKEVKVMEEIFDQMNNEVDKNAVDKQCAEIEKKNLLIENENLIVNCLSTQLLYDVEKSRCLDLEADMSEVHDESKLISKLEREYLNLQLKYQHLQESFDNKKSQASQEAPDFNSFFKITQTAAKNEITHCQFLASLTKNSMAEQNVPAQPPTRTDEQIVPRSQWLTIGKSNLLFNAQKIQKNPIFQISVDILKNTNFFQALTASANVPAIYLQQFWKTMSYNEKTGVYSCQLDEQWFDLSADLLRKALAITPVNPTLPFELPPTGDTVLDFVNELGYPEPVEFVSSIRTNYVYQPWRAFLSLLNQCLTGKTSGSDKPRHPVLQMLWGIVTQTNVDHAELIWEEFTQGIQTFFSHKASHKASMKNPKKKATPLLIPYGRFSKVIIYYLASNNDIHRRPDSAVHHTGDDYVLGNLKFVPKGETVEVFGMAIPDPLITEAIQQSSYYPNYLKMVAANTKKTPQGGASSQPATKRATPKKPTKVEQPPHQSNKSIDQLLHRQ
ncbi:hypothetical protein Tco_0004109 [Tanacetum coccineum]